MKWRELAPGQRSQLIIFDRANSNRVLFETREAIIEAPNWSPDGEWLVFNSDGLLYKIKADGSGPPRQIPAESLTDNNNDHVLSPDGRFIYTSSNDGHLYRVSMDGGPPQCVTDDSDELEARYLHGISPDGSTLAFIGSKAHGTEKLFNIFTLSLPKSTTTQLTRSGRHHDGAEFSPDGEWIYFNSDRASETEGHSQLFRMRPNGQELEQLTFDDRVNWFPHLSPDGSSMIYLSYEHGTVGHPANQDVILRQADPEGMNGQTLAAVFGGQGTINVNSWAPDSRRFAFVAYPISN